MVGSGNGRTWSGAGPSHPVFLLVMFLTKILRAKSDGLSTSLRETPFARSLAANALRRRTAAVSSSASLAVIIVVVNATASMEILRFLRGRVRGDDTKLLFLLILVGEAVCALVVIIVIFLCCLFVAIKLSRLFTVDYEYYYGTEVRME